MNLQKRNTPSHTSGTLSSANSVISLKKKLLKQASIVPDDNLEVGCAVQRPVGEQQASMPDTEILDHE